MITVKHRDACASPERAPAQALYELQGGPVAVDAQDLTRETRHYPAHKSRVE